MTYLDKVLWALDITLEKERLDKLMLITETELWRAMYE